MKRRSSNNKDWTSKYQEELKRYLERKDALKKGHKRSHSSTKTDKPAGQGHTASKPDSGKATTPTEASQPDPPPSKKTALPPTKESQAKRRKEAQRREENDARHPYSLFVHKGIARRLSFDTSVAVKLKDSIITGVIERGIRPYM